MKRRGRPDGRPPRGPRPPQDLVDLAVLDAAHAMEYHQGDLNRDDSPGELDWTKVARVAVGATLRAMPALTRAGASSGPATAGPREVGSGEAVIAHDGEAGAIMDLSRAVLVDELTTMRVAVGVADGDLAAASEDAPIYAMQLSGALAGTRGAERATITYLLDVDGIVRVVGDLLALAERSGVPAVDLFARIGTYLQGDQS